MRPSVVQNVRSLALRRLGMGLALGFVLNTVHPRESGDPGFFRFGALGRA